MNFHSEIVQSIFRPTVTVRGCLSLYAFAIRMCDETREVTAVVFGLRHLIVNAGAKGLGAHYVISRQIAFPTLAKSVLLVSEFSKGQ